MGDVMRTCQSEDCNNTFIVKATSRQKYCEKCRNDYYDKKNNIDSFEFYYNFVEYNYS